MNVVPVSAFRDDNLARSVGRSCTAALTTKRGGFPGPALGMRTAYAKLHA
jgi:hypothetical protein